jgi:hypothetical protein
MEPRPQRGIESTQRRVIQVGKKIPEQAQIERGPRREAELLLETMP